MKTMSELYSEAHCFARLYHFAKQRGAFSVVRNLRIRLVEARTAILSAHSLSSASL